jgi:pyruvate dehydrogenase E2 component (dihydrolipoamide acetyltransferase)
LSPAVRKLVDEHGVDPATIDGSGRDGRVTRDDVLALVDAHPPAADRPGVHRLPFTAIRRTIGRNLVASLATAAHTLVVVEVDYVRVAPVKERTGLTWLPFIARAVIDALADFPLLNAHVGDDGLDVHDEVHLGIAVDLDYEGLVVPVVRDTRRLRLPALAAALQESARAAREHRLAADDYAGGTFTLTNAGRYGTLLTAPIINQPQAAILATDGVKVRPVAVPLADGGHGLAFHPVGNLALSFDHRAFDGAYASAFAAKVRDTLEQRDWDEEVR